MKSFDEGETDLGNLLKSLAPTNSPARGLRDLADLFSPPPAVGSLGRSLSNLLGEQSSVNTLSPARGSRGLADLFSPPPTVGSLARSLSDLAPPRTNNLARGLRELGEQSSINALMNYGLAPVPLPPPSAVWQWAYVRRRFGQLVANLTITPKQLRMGRPNRRVSVAA